MGVEGCAYATVIAQGISALLCLVYIIKKFDVLKLKKRDFKFSFFVIRKLLSLGVPMGLQFSITAIGTIIVQGAINVYGPVSMAGSKCMLPLTLFTGEITSTTAPEACGWTGRPRAPV